MRYHLRFGLRRTKIKRVQHIGYGIYPIYILLYRRYVTLKKSSCGRQKSNIDFRTNIDFRKQ